ncbi:hypothetical protein A6769_27550 [Nostoc punctiforme NIES-2108]|uniref:Uncharacterized protein n=1 Tax=Nostoc punctiforme NIES-2108 TaxID=1356359 RepID=A0A367R7Z5_NOSPU|nr:hypothetical protein A6769_27550 [Nostoc punctiforme NIES-2108]
MAAKISGKACATRPGDSVSRADCLGASLSFWEKAREKQYRQAVLARISHHISENLVQGSRGGQRGLNKAH